LGLRPGSGEEPLPQPGISPLNFAAGKKDRMSAESESEMQQENGQEARPGRGVYWLPNLLTTGTLFGGFYAIVAAIDGNFARSATAVFIAMVFDGLDGRVARWTKTQSDFGKEYDSLCDMVAFGLAPAILVYQWGIERIADYGQFWTRFGWLAAFFYAVAAGLRLARFNSRAAVADKRYFEGLPSPSAAATVAGFIWLVSEIEVTGLPRLVLAFTVSIIAGALMVSKFAYWSGKELNVRGRIPWMYMLVIPLIYVLVSLAPLSLFVAFGTYALSGPLVWLWVKMTRKKRPVESA
jgi:CDP-diacylglycerol--serine O-phosphatidyltransferase